MKQIDTSVESIDGLALSLNSFLKYWIAKHEAEDDIVTFLVLRILCLVKLLKQVINKWSS